MKASGIGHRASGQEKTWEEMVAEAKTKGAVEICPNGLPVCCITGEAVLEHEHAAHADYKFPVTVDYVGRVNGDSFADFEVMVGRRAAHEDEVRGAYRETHALIYTDGHVALTLFEYTYSLWHVRSGECIHHGIDKAASSWKLSTEAVEKISSVSGKA